LKEALINDIAMEWQEKVKSSNGVRMKMNELSILIHEKKEAHQHTHVEVSCLLIHQCVRKKQADLPTSCWYQNPNVPC
jgi:hypothetical protein